MDTISFLREKLKLTKWHIWHSWNVLAELNNMVHRDKGEQGTVK